MQTEDDIVPERLLEAEWLSVSAIREISGLAFRRLEPPTYRNSLVIGEELYPALFHRDRSLLWRKQESATAKLYHQIAEKRSKMVKKDVAALDLIDEVIHQHEEMLEIDKGQNANHIKGQLEILRRARRELDGTKKKYEEGDIILRDLNVGAKLPISNIGDGYREFELPDNRVMRIRLFHPNKRDRISGIDVIYEHFRKNRSQVRVAALQYKMWDGETLYETSKITSQLQKLKELFCCHGCCTANSDQRDAYRLRCCAAFLRPTDELQEADARLISSGYHIPICRVEALWKPTQRTGKMLTWQDFRSESVTYRVFEELFNTDMLGSKWMASEELEDFYRSHHIFEYNEELDDRLLMHVQTY